MGEGGSAPPQPCKHGAGRWGLRWPGEWHSGHRTTELSHSPLPWGKALSLDAGTNQRLKGWRSLSLAL